MCDWGHGRGGDLGEIYCTLPQYGALLDPSLCPQSATPNSRVVMGVVTGVGYWEGKGKLV